MLKFSNLQSFHMAPPFPMQHGSHGVDNPNPKGDLGYLRHGREWELLTGNTSRGIQIFIFLIVMSWRYPSILSHEIHNTLPRIFTVR